MAGIGFELKKLYGENNGITRTVGAMCYSTAATIGPTLLVVIALIAVNLLMSWWGVDEYEKMTFAGCMLYCFILALMVSSVFDTVISRYVSDCLFSDKTEKILPAVQGSTMITCIILGAIGLALSVCLYFIAEISLYYVLVTYLTLMGTGLTFSLSVFATAVKSYRRISFCYLIGVTVLILTALICRVLIKLPIGESLMTGFALGFLSIAVHLYYYLHMAFPKGDRSYFGFFESLGKNKFLLLSGIFYVLGLYIHNIVFWAGSDLYFVVRKILFCAPSYDMASFLAMLTSVSAMVMFVVRVETSFYPEYKNYCEAVIGNNLSRINFTRERMIRTLLNEVYFVGEFQIIITIIVMVLSMTLLPLIGIAGIALDIYPVLALGYYSVFMMHILMIFLYYFDDQKGAAFVGIMFFLLTFIFTVITRLSGIAYYGLGLVLAAVITWLTAFLRLRSILRNVDYKMFCDNIKVRM